MKSNPLRGGYITDVVFQDITVGTVGDAVIEIALNYENIDTGDFYPDVHGIEVNRLTSASGQLAWNLIGNDANPIRDVRLRDCAFDGIEEGVVAENVEGLALRRVTINGEPVGDGTGA
jgi:hypothetical protein